MKRRNAILLGLVFLLMVAGYLAWCWRGFHLPTKFSYHLGFVEAPQVETLVENWHTEHAGWDAPRFDGRLALRMLILPWYDYRGSTTAFLDHRGDDRIECRIIAPHARKMAVLWFVKVDGNWSLESEATRATRKP
jgi:hypothetical protein